MANDEDVARIRQGAAVWNDWRAQNHEHRVDLSGANLESAHLWEVSLGRADLQGAHLWGVSLVRADLQRTDLSKATLREADLYGATLFEANLEGADLYQANLGRADLRGANLGRADLYQANLQRAELSKADLSKADLRETDLSLVDLGGANLSGADLRETDLSWANLQRAELSWADLGRADLNGADLGRADLRGANLEHAILIKTNLTGADLTGCRVYGISAWDLKLEGAKQRDLVITRRDEPQITVDNLEVAQFIYLLLHNEKIRSVINTITSKVVLILGRFTPERKAVLDALRDELRKHDYLPVLFDFDKPASKDLTGTVSTLANMARFIIADLTDPSCIPHELAMVIPTTVVPVQPILLEGMREYAMFIDLKKRHHWVLEPYSYNTQKHLITDLSERVIGPAEAKVRELRG